MGLGKSLRKFMKRRFSPEAYLHRQAIARTEQRVLAGPFEGMQYADRSIGSAYMPKILGTYERELYPLVEEVIQGDYDSLIDIGAAEGFFAVGLAMRQQAPILAFEADDDARKLSQEVARKNNVEDRIDFQGFCEPENLELALSKAQRPFVLCDVEGAEAELLDFRSVPALEKAAILVEIHEFARPGITAEIFRRFSETHNIEVIWQQERVAEDYPFEDFWTKRFPARYLRRMVEEGRGYSQSWLWMTPKNLQPFAQQSGESAKVA